MAYDITRAKELIEEIEQAELELALLFGVVADAKRRREAKQAAPIRTIRASEQDASSAGSLTREQYNAVLQAFSETGESAPIAAKLPLPLAEINKAVQTKQYASYLKKRV